MKTFDQIYNLVLESIDLTESIKDVALDKFGIENSKYVEKFLNEIRHKETDPKKKDINYWLKEGIDKFKEYVDTFKSKKEVKKAFQNVTQIDNGKGKLLGIYDGYELWQADSYKAVKFLGRNYKSNPTRWCISSDDEKYWNQYYYIDDYRFYFLISQTPTKDVEDKKWNKVSIQVKKDAKLPSLVVWDAFDNFDRGNKYKWYDDLPPYLQNIVLDNENKLVWYEISNIPLMLKIEKELWFEVFKDDEIIEKIKEYIKLNTLSKEDLGIILKKAVDRNRLDIVKYLVENTDVNINIDSFGEDGLLYYPAIRGSRYFPLIKYLIEHGFKVTKEVLIHNSDLIDEEILQYLKDHLTN